MQFEAQPSHPAHAGKTIYRKTQKDHPRVCGKDYQKRLYINNIVIVVLVLVILVRAKIVALRK
ncbi:hypothetical protein CJ216_02180 [Gardnerella greenwoodii]|uniref:Uncharacterized protein n=1 Tax=Gardnerella greenwoodii TaxID=2914925 RepID=A0A2N6RXS8_9BIFI|nr:hypothetical protein CJ216_02180 [Gardnerella greenwoodii]